MLAEIHLLRGEIPEAHQGYRALVQWSTADPYKDGWGGSGLAAVALWRWLQIVGNSPNLNKQEVEQLLVSAQKMQQDRLFRGMVSTPLLESLPQVEEESGRTLARLAWLTGHRNEAVRLFLDYLQVARSKERNEVEQQIWRYLVETRQASNDRLALLVAIRLSTLGQRETAAAMLTTLLESTDSDVRARAGYHLALLLKNKRGAHPMALDRLSKALEDAADPRLFQEILFERSVIYDLPGKGYDAARSIQDLKRLIAEFPDGSLSNEAMYQLGRRFQDQGDTEQALKYYGQLQQREANNNRFELSYYQASLALYGRARPNDLSRSRRLLQEFLGKRPNAEVRLPVLFWLGRLAEESGDNETAQNYFRRIVDERPYDYYAIRSRMHLSLGSNARFEISADRQTQLSLGAAYRDGTKDVAMGGDSPYAKRLREGLQSGIYSRGLQATAELRHRFPGKRVEDLRLEDLDSSGLLSRISLLLAFRQDALAAIDTHPDDRLRVAISADQLAQDQPLSISLCEGKSNPDDQDSNIQQNQEFLSTSYPIVFSAAFRKAGLEHDLQPGLLYAIARQESFLYPYALSHSGALGLFQFIAPTFESLDKRWNLTRNSGVDSRQEYLLDPDRSIDLGARWFREELLPWNKGNLLGAVLEHIAGRNCVKEWRSRLQAMGRLEDVEYAVESIPYMDARDFTRGVLADTAIVTSAGILHSDHGSPSQAAE